MWHVVGVGEGESEVVLLNQVQVVVDLLHQLSTRRLFLKKGEENIVKNIRLSYTSENIYHMFSNTSYI